MLVTVETLKLNSESDENENKELSEDELEGECEMAKLPAEARL